MEKARILRNLVCLLLIVIVAGCRAVLSEDEPSVDNSETLVDNGSWYTREQWPHDGNPYQSPNFIIYSDAASPEAREELAAIAEDLLSELISEFGVDPAEMFRFPPGQNKIHIYTYKSYFPRQWGMRAYWGGVIAWSLDHEERGTKRELYQPVLKHELVHVIESLLKGRDVANISPAVRTQAWFSEGLAEAVAGGTSGFPVKGLEQLETLTAQYGNLNPIAYKTDGVLNLAQETHPKIGLEYYYPMSQLAVEYLLDPGGQGRTLFDVRDIFLDMAEGLDFPTAFEANLGISIQVYEAEFFDLMEGYLGKGPALIVLGFLDFWPYLCLGSILLVIWKLMRNPRRVLGMRWAWLWLAALFGPVGFIVYLISVGNQRLETSKGWRGLVAAMYSAAGKGVGILIMVYFFHFIAPDGDSGPLIILAPFLVSWLAFRGPLLGIGTGVSYWAALYRSALSELGSTALVLLGMLPVLIILPEKAWIFSADPTHPHFWGLVSLSLMAGTATVYPFWFWLEHLRYSQQEELAAAP